MDRKDPRYRVENWTSGEEAWRALRSRAMVDQVPGDRRTRLNATSDRPDGSVFASRMASSLETATTTPPGGPVPAVADQPPLSAAPAFTASTRTPAATIWPDELIRSTWSPGVAMAPIAGSASRTCAATRPGVVDRGATG